MNNFDFFMYIFFLGILKKCTVFYLDVQTTFQTPTVLRRVKFRLVRYLCQTDTHIMNAGVAFVSVGLGLGWVRSVEFQAGWQAKVGPG